MSDRGFLRPAEPHSRTAAAALVTAALTLISCSSGTGSAGSIPKPNATPDPCVIALESTVPRKDSLIVAVTEPIRLPDGTPPHNSSEQLVLRQLYETLVRVDCEGQIRPAIARQWTVDASGLEWTFEIRPGLLFADSTPIDARAVGVSWAGKGAPEVPWAAITQVEAIDSLRLRVRLAAPPPAPSALADPLLAVAGAPGGSGWPIESGGYRIASADTGSNSLEIASPPAAARNDLLSAITLVPARSEPGGPALRFVAVPGVDPRDLIDQRSPGVDVVITRDPSTLAYARSRTDLHAMPLPWDRTYVLITPASVAPAPPPDPADRNALARDAVRGDARGAEPPFWWEGDTDSPCVTRIPAAPTKARGIAFPRGDLVARSLAERVLALVTSAVPPPWLGLALGAPGSMPLRILAVDPAALDSLIAEGGATAFVTSFPRLRPAGCRRVPPRPAGFNVIPLVETRAHLIARRGVPPFAVEGDGMVRFLPYSSP